MIKKILVIQLRRIGDVLLTTPAVRALKKTFPDAEIDFLTEPPCHEVLWQNPDIQEILVYEKRRKLNWFLNLRKRNYDCVIDFLGTPTTMLLTAFSGAPLRAGPGGVFWKFGYNRLMNSTGKLYAPAEKTAMLGFLGVKPDSTLPVLKLKDEDVAWAKSFAAGFAPSGRLIAFAPASRKITRQYPWWLYARLARLVTRDDWARVVILWGPGEKETARKIAEASGGRTALAPETGTLGKLAALISRADFLITNCNGPKHIAVAVGTPTLTIYGSSPPSVWNPPDDGNHRVIRLESLKCIGCGLAECPEHLECLMNLPPEEIHKEVLSFFNK